MLISKRGSGALFVCGGATGTDSEGNLTEYKHVNMTGGCLRIGGAYRILKQEGLITEVRESRFTACDSEGQVLEKGPVV